MLVGVAPLPPSLIPAHWNIGILYYKQTKLRKDMQHSVSRCGLFIENLRLAISTLDQLLLSHKSKVG